MWGTIGPELERVQDAAREWLGHLTEIAMEYSHEELSNATSSFSSGSCLGAGGAGTVYRGLLRGSTEVAIKVLVDMGGLEGFEDEVRVLSRFRHPNLVTLLGWGQHNKKKYLVYELLHGGDVDCRLKKAKSGKVPFTWEERLRVATDAASGLSHMVSGKPKIFHRDIKPANILLDSGGTAKMADFGLAGVIHTGDRFTVESVSGTPGYTCPEYAQTGCVSEPSEVYSFGIVLLELLVNQPPALASPDGDLIFPLLQAVRPSAPGAHERLLAALDPLAGWPAALADSLGDLALACVDAPERRPGFEVVGAALRRLGRPEGRAARTPDRPDRTDRPDRPREAPVSGGSAVPASSLSTASTERYAASDAATCDEAATRPRPGPCSGRWWS